MDTAAEQQEKPTPMLEWLRSHTTAEREELAQKVGTSVMYLYQIGMRYRNPSIKLAKKIEYESGYTISREKLLFPEDYMQ